MSHDRTPPAMPDPDPYRAPLYYDLEYEDQVEDIGWYVDLARRHGGPVLELGCGNGRITLELARAGIEVHGLDQSREMLADLDRKRRAAPEEVRRRIHIEEADFLALQGPPCHPLVVLPFNTIHHLHPHRSVLKLLEGVRRRLRPGGTFALDLYRPSPALYGRDPEERYGERVFRHPETDERIDSWEQSWYDPLRQVHHVRYVYVHASGHRHQVDLPLRVFYPLELEALIDWGGFRIETQLGDFAGGPVTADSAKWLLILRDARA